MLFQLLFKKPKPRYFTKLKKRYRGILDAINDFGISLFLDTSNMLSLCTFETFYAVNFATSDMLPLVVFRIINFATFIIIFFLKLKTRFKNSLERLLVVAWLFDELTPERYFIKSLNDDGDSLEEEECLPGVIRLGW